MKPNNVVQLNHTKQSRNQHLRNIIIGGLATYLLFNHKFGLMSGETFHESLTSFMRTGLILAVVGIGGYMATKKEFFQKIGIVGVVLLILITIMYFGG